MKQYISYLLSAFLAVGTHFHVSGQLSPWTAGRLDRTFGTNGLLPVPGSGGSIAGGETLFLPDGSILSVNTYLNDLPSTIRVLKLTPEGLPDKSFGAEGHVTIAFKSHSYASGIVQLPNGKILIAGTVSSDNTQIRQDWVIIRLDPDGSIDQTFGGQGIFRKDFSEQDGEVSNDIAGGLLLEADGKILASGITNRLESDQLYSTRATIIRLTPDGELDSTFGNAGISRVQIGTNRVNVQYGLRGGRLYRKSDGGLIVGLHAERELKNSPGSYVPKGFLLKFTPDGSIDKTFGTGGILDLTPAGSSEFSDLVFDSAGRLIVANALRISRYMPGGQLDISFGDDGHYLSPGGNFYYFDLEISANGKILATGAESIPLVPNGLRTGGHLFRLSAEGTPDLRFGRGGYAFLSSDEFDVSFVASNTRNGRITTMVFQSEDHYGFLGLARHYFAK